MSVSSLNQFVSLVWIKGIGRLQYPATSLTVALLYVAGEETAELMWANETGQNGCFSEGNPYCRDEMLGLCNSPLDPERVR